MPSDLTLEQEQEAFEAQLDALLSDHRGQWVVFKGGQPAGFFDDHAQAYESGLKMFGLDVPFLVQQVTKHNGDVVSLAWEAGVMLG